MFGWTLIRKDDLKELERSHRVHMRAVECHRWFAGWKDLDYIWNYLFQPQWTVDRVRDDYAKSRHTDAYGKPLEQPRSDEGGGSEMKVDKEQVKSDLEQAYEYICQALPHLGDIKGHEHQVQHAEHFIKQAEAWVFKAMVGLDPDANYDEWFTK